MKALADLLADGLQLAQLPAGLVEWLEEQGYRVLNLVPDSVGARRPGAAFYPPLVAIAAGAIATSERVAVVVPTSFYKRALGAPLRASAPDRILDLSGCFLHGVGLPIAVFLGGRAHPTGTVALVVSLAAEPRAPRTMSRGRAWTELLGHWDDDEWHGQYFEVIHAGVAGWAQVLLSPEDGEGLDRALKRISAQRDALITELERIAALPGSAEQAEMAREAVRREPQSARYGVEYALREVAARARTALEGVRRG